MKVKIEWFFQTQSVAKVERDGALFAVIVQPHPKGFMALGLVTSMRGNETGDAAVRAVLDNHGHQFLGSFKTEAGAQRAAAKFMRTAPVPAACACDDVVKPRRRRRAAA